MSICFIEEDKGIQDAYRMWASIRDLDTSFILQCRGFMPNERDAIVADINYSNKQNFNSFIKKAPKGSRIIVTTSLSTNDAESLKNLGYHVFEKPSFLLDKLFDCIEGVPEGVLV